MKTRGNYMGFKALPTLISLFITLLIWFVIPVPNGVDPDAWHLLAMFVGVIAAIIGKAMPIGAIAIIAITLVATQAVPFKMRLVALLTHSSG